MSDPLINFDCPACGQNLEAAEFNAGKSFSCPGCQTSVIVPASVTSSAPAPRPAATHKSCPFCGETILAKAVKCKHCGEFLDGRRRITMSAQPIVQTREVQTIEQTAKRYKAAMLLWGAIVLLSGPVFICALGIPHRNTAVISGIVLALASGGYMSARLRAWWSHG